MHSLILTVADILDRVSPKFHRLGLAYECLGGGRIDHDSKHKKIKIYGYSVVSLAHLHNTTSVYNDDQVMLSVATFHHCKNI